MTDGASDDVAIDATNLTKFYRRHHGNWARVLDFASFLLRGRHAGRLFENAYVLNNIDLTVRKGCSLGIIGQNGCGKSTLLKMVASLINPSSGKITVHGRVASIIELGAGFNPEDSGLDNINSYLTIHGVPSAAFPDKIRAIIEFSGLGEKISDPVKSYSSGMVVRLAFAIIAHLDADILLVDEALAVGDAVFAQKCMRFIKAFKARGTILFVSHDLNALQNLCDEVIWLHGGVIREQGDPKKVCEEYLAFTLAEDYPDMPGSGERNADKGVEELVAQGALLKPTSAAQISSDPDFSRGFGGHRVDILDVAFASSNGERRKLLSDGEPLALSVRLIAKDDIAHPIVGFLVKNSRGVEIFGENTLHISEKEPFKFGCGQRYRVEFRFQLPILPSGDYTVSVAVADGDFHQHQQLVWRHDVLIMRISSARFRYGVLGLSASTITLHEEAG
jgi:lipopolysaccharide transport system ATP-binding protein